MLGDEDDSGGGLMSVAMDPATQTFHLYAPLGLLSFSVEADGFYQLGADGLFQRGSERIRVSLEDKGAVHRVQMARAATLVARVRFPSAPEPAEVDVFSSDESIAISRGTVKGIARFPDLPPGQYTVYVTLAARFKKSGGRRVTLTVGESADVEFIAEIASK